MRTLPIGKGEKLRDGNDIAVLSTGPIASEVTEAIKRAEKELDIRVAHYDMIFVKPLDVEIVSEIAEKGCPVITVEDGISEGGLGSAVTEMLSDLGSAQHIRRLGVPDRFISQGTPAQLHHLCGFDADGIFQAIKESYIKTQTDSTPTE